MDAASIIPAARALANPRERGERSPKRDTGIAPKPVAKALKMPVKSAQEIRSEEIGTPPCWAAYQKIRLCTLIFIRGEAGSIRCRAYARGDMRRHYALLLSVLLCLISPVQAEPDFSSPEATMRTYMEACQAGDFVAADACYTESSRAFLAKNPALRDSRPVEALIGTYERLSKVTFTTEMVNTKRAILRPDDPKLPPYFLRIQNPKEQWRIDWNFMANYIRANDKGWSWANPRAEGIWKSRP